LNLILCSSEQRPFSQLYQNQEEYLLRFNVQTKTIATISLKGSWWGSDGRKGISIHREWSVDGKIQKKRRHEGEKTQKNWSVFREF
jgi:hypothetical protein